MIVNVGYNNRLNLLELIVGEFWKTPCIPINNK